MKVVDDRVGGRACHNQICPKGRDGGRNGLDLFTDVTRPWRDAAFIDLLGRSYPGTNKYILCPKMNCTVGFVNCFLRVPLAYQPCCPVPCCPGKQGELSENCLPNLTVQFILGRSILGQRESSIRYAFLTCWCSSKATSKLSLS